MHFPCTHFANLDFAICKTFILKLNYGCKYLVLAFRLNDFAFPCQTALATGTLVVL